MSRKVLILFLVVLLGYSAFVDFNREQGKGSGIAHAAEEPRGLLRIDDETKVVPPKAVDLTEEGVLDWANWGFGAKEWTDYSQYTHKAAVSPLIKLEPKVVIDKLKNGSDARVYWSEEPTGNILHWTDGTPTKVVKELDACIWMAGLGNGFRVSVPASTERRYLKLYLGAWEAEGELTASLSDKSAPVVTSTFKKAGTDYSERNIRQYTLEFLAASEDATLTIDWLVSEVYDADGWGNVTLRAVTLSDKP